MKTLLSIFILATVLSAAPATTSAVSTTAAEPVSFPATVSPNVLTPELLRGMALGNELNAFIFTLSGDFEAAAFYRGRSDAFHTLADALEFGFIVLPSVNPPAPPQPSAQFESPASPN